MITGRTALYGVIGHPIAHTRSPQMQDVAFARAGLDAAYLALPVAPGGPGRGAARGSRPGLPAGSTSPCRTSRRRSGSPPGPTRWRAGWGRPTPSAAPPHGWEAFNTDGPATRALLLEAGLSRGARALLLGAGGAARAAAWALLELGCELVVLARRPEAAAELLRTLPPGSGPAPRAGALADLAREAAAADAIVNGTSVGLHGNQPSFPGLAFRRGQLAADFVYGETAFAASAREAGAQLVTGEAILVRQGALAFTLWTGQPAPEAEMARAVAEPAGSTR